jgi:hypothetical protein
VMRSVTSAGTQRVRIGLHIVQTSNARVIKLSQY